MELINLLSSLYVCCFPCLQINYVKNIWKIISFNQKILHTYNFQSSMTKTELYIIALEIRFTELQKLSQWLPYQILGGKTVNRVEMDPQTTEIWSTDLNVPLTVSDGRSELHPNSLSFKTFYFAIIYFFSYKVEFYQVLRRFSFLRLCHLSEL